MNPKMKASLSAMLFSVLALLSSSDAFMAPIITSRTTASLVGRIALVPEQAKELEDYFKGECEQLKSQNDGGPSNHHSEHDTASVVQKRRGGPVAWCLRVWSGPGNNQKEHRRQHSSVTSTSAHPTSRSSVKP